MEKKDVWDFGLILNIHWQTRSYKALRNDKRYIPAGRSYQVHSLIWYGCLPSGERLSWDLGNPIQLFFRR
jgi:hypothetical protein